MKYKLKSNLLIKEFDFYYKSKVADMSLEAASDFYNRNKITNERKIMNILIGYADSIEEISNDKDINLDVDLTYSTIKNLPLLIAYVFSVSVADSLSERMDIAVKSLAAYLILLCENEHNCGIEITCPAFLTANSFDFGWSGNIVRTGLKKKTDLLEIAKRSVKFSKGTLTIHNEELEKNYEEMTGIKLSDYGFDGLEARLK